MALTRFHLHLVSDSTGDTVHSVARACLVQFDEAQAVEHVWSMVRTRSQIDRVLAGIETNHGLVLFTMVDDALRQALQDGCRRLQVPAIPVLDPVIGDYQKGLYVSQETARAIREKLLPIAQIIVPNRFEAEVLLNRRSGIVCASMSVPHPDTAARAIQQSVAGARPSRRLRPSRRRRSSRTCRGWL